MEITSATLAVFFALLSGEVEEYLLFVVFKSVHALLGNVVIISGTVPTSQFSTSRCNFLLLLWLRTVSLD